MPTSSRLQNISEMEKHYTNLELNIKETKRLLSKLKKSLPEYSKLLDYYESEQWEKDYDDVNTGKIKPTGSHGILSEDSIYDYYQEQRNLCLELIKIATKYLEK